MLQLFQIIPSLRPFALVIHAVAQMRGDRKAVTAIEYGLIAALIAVVIIVALVSVGTGLTGVFNAVGSKLTSAT